MTELLALDATDQLAALDRRQISARELLQACIDRADATAATLNAVVARDLERAFAAAQGIDDRRARGEPLGRLAGLPMTIKDVFEVEGLPARAGLTIPPDPKARDAEVVARVRREGATLWGKTNVPAKGSDTQTFNALYGTTNNPWDVTRTPGGSSGGAAVAVATGITALEIGSDIGGSLRVPAGFCGVYAHKPTYGLVPQRGHWPAALSEDVDYDLGVVGPLARSARDLSLLLSIIADAPMPREAAPRDLKGLKIGLLLDEPAFALDADVKAALEIFARKLADAGAMVEPVPCPVDADEMIHSYVMLLYPLITADAGLAARTMYEAMRGPAKLARALGAGPLSWGPAILAASARHRDWLAADRARRRMQRIVAPIFDRYDVLLSPTAPVTAFKHDHSPLPFRRLELSDGRKVAYTETLGWNALATVCGLPATAIPAGLSAAGLPVGAQLIGPSGGDFRVLDIAQAIGETVGGFVAPPRPCV
jgi:amidase